MRYSKLINMVLYGTCGILWFVNWLRDGGTFDLILSVVWFSGAAIWLARFFKENNGRRNKDG